MDKTLRLKSPAKVNLMLEILRKREDGYHEIRTVFQKIDLCDTIHFSLTKGKGVLITTNQPRLPVGRSNLVYKAARAFLSRSGYRGGIAVHIEKRIPLGAGLGGGSSNAATTLKALNQLLEGGLSREEMLAMGTGIGADVPFFLMERGCALATGIGERLERIELPGLWFILIYPNFEVSTRWAYQNFELTPPPRQTLPFRAETKVRSGSILSNPQSLDWAVEGLTKRAFQLRIQCLVTAEEVSRVLKNDLEGVVSKKFPQIGQMEEILISAGALGSLMTGSGPTVFGAFAEEGEARRAYKMIRKRVQDNGWIALKARSLPLIGKDQIPSLK